MTDRITPRHATGRVSCSLSVCLSVCLWLGVRVNVFPVRVRSPLFSPIDTCCCRYERPAGCCSRRSATCFQAMFRQLSPQRARVSTPPRSGSASNVSSHAAAEQSTHALAALVASRPVNVHRLSMNDSLVARIRTRHTAARTVHQWTAMNRCLRC